MSVGVEQSYVAPNLIEGTVVSYAEEFFTRCGHKDKVAFIAVVSRLPESNTVDSAINPVGRCTNLEKNSDGTPGGGAVYLLLEAWLRASPAKQRALVWHELAHCALGKPHADNELMRGDGITEEEAVRLTPEVMVGILGCQ